MSRLPAAMPAGLQRPLLSAPALQASEEQSLLGAPVLLGASGAGCDGSAKALGEASRGGGERRPEAASCGGTAGHSAEASGGGGGPASLWERIVEAAQDLFSPSGAVLRPRRACLQAAGETQEAAARRRHEDEALRAMPSAPLISVMAAMSKYDGSDMAEAGCRRLCELQAQQEPGLLAAGAAELVLRAMERHKGGRALPIQEAGVHFLRDAASTREGQGKVTAAGGCQAVLRAMSGQAALGSPSMQELGCGAVLNLARDHSEGGSRGDAAWRVGMRGGVEAVLEAMRASGAHPRVQERACAALRALMLDQSNQVTVLESGGIQAMLHAVATHSADAAVAREVCSALLLLAKDYSDSLPRMVAAGARDAVARCKAGHGGDAAVQVTSWSLLNILGSAQEERGAPGPPAAGEETLQI